jgi:hypothetical protein
MQQGGRIDSAIVVSSCQGLCDACPDVQACEDVMTPRGQASHNA